MKQTNNKKRRVSFNKNKIIGFGYRGLAMSLREKTKNKD